MKRLSLTMTCVLAGLLLLFATVPAFAVTTTWTAYGAGLDAYNTAPYNNPENDPSRMIQNVTLAVSGADYVITMNLTTPALTDGHIYTVSLLDPSLQEKAMTSATYDNDLGTNVLGGFVNKYTTDISGNLVKLNGNIGSDFSVTNGSKTLTWIVPTSKISFDSSLLYLSGKVFDNDPNHTRLAQTTTPIPGAIWLLGSGIIGLVGLKRRSTGIATT